MNCEYDVIYLDMCIDIQYKMKGRVFNIWSWYFSLHHTSMNHRQSKLSQIETKVKSQYKGRLEQNLTDNAKVGSETELYCIYIYSQITDS